MAKHVGCINVGMNDWIEAYRNVAVALSNRGRKTASMRYLAYADTVARALFDDIQRGEWGGTYYMDGRAVRQSDPSLYAVGGAYPTGITMELSEIDSYVDVLAAMELLREVVVELQSDSDEPIAIGFWIDSADDGLCWFDVSNIVSGEEEALSLARKRGELAIYHFSSGDEVRVASRNPIARKDHGRSFADFKMRNSRWYRESVGRR